MVKRHQIYGDKTSDLWSKDNRFMVSFSDLQQFTQKPVVTNHENPKSHTQFNSNETQQPYTQDGKVPLVRTPPYSLLPRPL